MECGRLGHGVLGDWGMLPVTVSLQLLCFLELCVYVCVRVFVSE